MSSRPPQDELSELLRRLTEDDISPKQHSRLAEILANDSQARARYRKVIDVHALLHWRERQTLEVTFPPVKERESAESVSPDTRFSKGILGMAYWREHRAKFAALALCLTVLFWAGFYFAVLHDGPGNDPPTNGVQASALARVSGWYSARWAEGAEALSVGDTLGSGQKIELDSGYLEVTFAKKSVVVLEGPAVFIVDGSNAGTLDSGRLVARVDTPQAVGFSIGTPLANIIDRGTEFGVEHSEHRGTVVEVFQGLVEATPLMRGNDHRVHPCRLSTGKTASLAMGMSDFVLSGESEPLQFVQELPAPGEPLPVRVITPVSVECSVISEGNHPAERLIDGSGFLGYGPLAGREHMAARFHADDTESERNYWIGQWGEGPVVLIFDLGAEYELHSLWMWNHSVRRQPYPSTVSRFRYAVSLDGETYRELGEEEIAHQFGVEGDSAQPFTVDAAARFVRIEVLDVFDSGAASEVALGEVRLEGTPFQQEQEFRAP